MSAQHHGLTPRRISRAVLALPQGTRDEVMASLDELAPLVPALLDAVGWDPRGPAVRVRGLVEWGVGVFRAVGRKEPLPAHVDRFTSTDQHVRKQAVMAQLVASPVDLQVVRCGNRLLRDHVARPGVESVGADSAVEQ